MDRRISRTGRRRWAWGLAAALLLLGTAGLARLGAAAFDRDVAEVRAADVTISTVVLGSFDDSIALRATATPLQTVFVDALEGGRVERLQAEDGAAVREGDLLAELSNASLQLELLEREADVIEQLNSLSSQELALQRGRADDATRLAEMEFREQQLGEALRQQQALADRGFVGAAALQRSRDEHDHALRLLHDTRRQHAASHRMEAQQLGRMREAGTRLADHLALARRNLRALEVRAPAAGQLTGFELRVGQTVLRGARIAQIDSQAEFKLSAPVDQFYLPRVSVGQPAVLADDGRSALRVNKIYPQVRDGEFRIDLVYSELPPRGLARGQTLNIRLQLGESRSALLLDAGAFLQDSGGAYAFVLDSQGRQAERRPIKLGRRNLQAVEVSDGLRAGERVVTSSYAAFADRRRLRLQP